MDTPRTLCKMITFPIRALFVLIVFSSCKKNASEPVKNRVVETAGFSVQKDIVQHIEDIKSFEGVKEVYNPQGVEGKWYREGTVQIAASPGESVGYSNGKYTWKDFREPIEMNKNDAALVYFLYNDKGATAHLYCYKNRSILEDNAKY